MQEERLQLIHVVVATCTRPLSSTASAMARGVVPTCGRASEGEASVLRGRAMHPSRSARWHQGGLDGELAGLGQGHSFLFAGVEYSLISRGLLRSLSGPGS